MTQRSRLGDLERSVMDRLWADTDDRWMTVRDVYEALVADRDIAYTTVMTVMQRLARKDLVEEQKGGRAYRYRAASSRGDLTAELMRAALDQAGSGDRSSALTRFVGSVTPDDVAALRNALEQLDDA